MHLDFEQIKSLITSGELEKALKILENGTENTPSNLEASFLQAREFKNRNQAGLGLINAEAADLESNKLTFATLELLEKVRNHFLLNEISYSGLLLYETPREVSLSKEERKYLQAFKKAETRHIGWELGMRYPPLVASLSFHVLWVVYFEGNPISQKLQRDFTLDQSWDNSWVADSWGYQEPGHWEPGKYRIEISINDTVVSSGDFKII